MTESPTAVAPGERQVERNLTDAWSAQAASRPLPESVDVVIVGGGIVGCTAAYFLARRGVSVALFEKGRIAGEQSSRNWGWVRQQGRSPVELPMMMRSLKLWQAFVHESGEDVGLHQGGSLFLAEDREQLDELAEWLPTAREHALETRLLAGRDLDPVITGASERFAGALYTASDARAEPGRAAPAFARAAEQAGARILSHCAVRGVERAAGAVAGVVTERGRVRTRTVVCAAGAWTRLFCRPLGITVPQLTVLATVARTAPAQKILDGEAWSPAIAIRRRADGGYTVAHGGTFRHSLTPDTLRFAMKFRKTLAQGHSSMRLRFDREFLEALATPSSWNLDAPSPFEKRRQLDPEPEPQVLRWTRDELARWHPAIGQAPFVETWGGMIEATPDVLPIISAVDACAGFHVATGFSGHGFGIGPGAGQLVADMVQGKADRDELHRFRLSRYFDGSPIVPGPSI